MASVLDLVKHYQHAIEKYSNDEQKILKSIDKLFNLDVTVQHLQETGVGRTVNALRKEPGDVGQAARALVYKWKLMVAAEESDQDGERNNESTSYNGHENGRDSDDNKKQKSNSASTYQDKSSTVKTEHKPMNGDYNSGSKRKYQSSEDEDSEPRKRRSVIKNEQYKSNIKKESSESVTDETDKSQSEDSESEISQASEEEQEIKSKHEIKKESSNSHSSSHSSSHPHHTEHKSKSSSSKRPNESSKHTKSSEKYSEKSTSKEKSHISNKYKSSKEKEPCEKQSKSSSIDKHSSSNKDKSEKEESSSSKHKSSSSKHKSSNSDSDKHKSDSEKHSSRSDKTKITSSSHNSKKEKHKSSSEKEISDEKVKIKSKDSSSSSKEKHSKEKSKDRSSSSKERSSEKKHSSSDKSNHSDSKPKSDKRDEGSSKDKTKRSSSSSSKSKSSSSKSKEDTPKKQVQISTGDSDDGIDCGSGASFAEALGMISPAKPKKKERSSLKDTVSPNTSNNDDLSPAALLAPTAKLAPLPALEISALPEISPNYKPRPPPKLLPHFTDEEAMSAVISSKNQRTKVYSGNKVIGKIPSLYEMCVHILQEHIDALEYTGGVPYDILKPVVDRANPQQLFMLEHFNPYLMDDTDHLWQKFCEKHFRNKRREEMETWREMYIRCQEEQEHRLKSLTANIKIAQEAKKAPIKQTKMAYVDTVVKPPRNVARKQALHGTAHAASASPAARVASLAAAPNVLRGNVRPTPSGSISTFQKPKKAPLMAKALQFMRGRKR